MQADPVVEDCMVFQPSGYMMVSSYDNVRPLKTDATAIRRWGVWCGGEGWREGGWREGCIIYILKYIHNK